MSVNVAFVSSTKRVARHAIRSSVTDAARSNATVGDPAQSLGRTRCASVHAVMYKLSFAIGVANAMPKSASRSNTASHLRLTSNARRTASTALSGRPPSVSTAATIGNACASNR